MIRTIADQYLAQNAGRRYPFKDDTDLPDWLPDSGVLDFRCTLYGVGAGTAPEARLVNVAHVGGGNVRFTVDLSAGGVVVDTIRFLVPSGMAGAPYTAYASGDRSTGALAVTDAAIPPNTGVLPYDAEVEYLESTETQYIDTGVIALADDSYDLDFWLNSLNGSHVFFGAANDGARRATVWVTLGGAIRFGGGGVVSFGKSVWKVGDWNSLHSSYSTTILNGVSAVNSFPYPFEDTSSTQNILLFKANGMPQSTIRKRISNLRWYRSGVLVRDLIPVRFTNERGQSEGATYDRVTKQLFRNAGTGAFLYGGDVAPAPAAGEYPVDIPFAATTVVCDSLKVMSLQSAHDAADARDVSDPDGRDPVAMLTGEIVLAEGRNAEPYLDGSRLRLDIRKGAGLGENCQAMASSQTCDNVLFAINGERPGSDGNIRIAGENGVSVTARPGEHAITIKLDDVARDRLAKECASACNGG